MERDVQAIELDSRGQAGAHIAEPDSTLSTRTQVELRRANSSFLSAVRHIVEREGLGGHYGYALSH